MAEPIKISTSKYTKSGKVEIDGHIWTVKLPGAATELRLSQAQRRIDVLERKIQNKTVTDEDLDRYDEYEKIIYDTFKNMFRDESDDNFQVTEWIEQTPLAIIVQVFEDIKEAANGRKESSESS